jgi:hypothetical protein
MRRGFLLTVLGPAAILSACEGAPETDETAQPEASEPVDLDPIGSYEAILSDGVVVTQTIRADGSYEDVSNGEVLETGNWRQDNGELCFDPEGVEAESCFPSGAPTAGERYEVTDGSGEVTMSVRKLPQDDSSLEETAPQETATQEGSPAS